MKLAIRDDDINFHFTPGFIEQNCRSVMDICPISMAVIPFVMGNWPVNTALMEARGPNGLTPDEIRAIHGDRDVKFVGENQLLVDYLNRGVQSGSICLMMHGIHHLNLDTEARDLAGGFAIRAEFNTGRDLTGVLGYALAAMNKIFIRPIEIFTPPQNSFSTIGMNSVARCGLNICANPPSIYALIDFLESLGLMNWFNYGRHRLGCKMLGLDLPYPKVMRHKGLKFIDHLSLQPGSNKDLFVSKLNYFISRNWDIVISTHSYGFGYSMKGGDQRMGEFLCEVLHSVQRRGNVDFCTLNELIG